MPRVSVVIPAYNASSTIAVAIKSVQNQTITDLEIIIVDDASTDSTSDVVTQLATCDDRIHLVTSEVNTGPGLARNRGIAVSTSPWIALLDADDRYDSDRLRRLLEIAQATSAHMVADNLWLCSAGDNPKSEPMLHDSELPEETVIDAAEFVRRNISSDARRTEYGFLKPIILRDFLTTTGIRYEAARFSEDYIFYLRCLLAGARWVVTPVPLYYYNISADTLTHQHSESDLLQLVDAETRLLDNETVRRNDQLSEMIGRHRQSVLMALSWFGFAEAIKRRDPMTAMRSLVSAPGSLSHIGRETARALPRVVARRGSGSSKLLPGWRNLPSAGVAFWVMIVLAATLGETAGDLLSMTLHVGYATSTIILVVLFFTALTSQVEASFLKPFLYWSVLLVAAVAGATTSDFISNSSALGYVGGSILLSAALLIVVGLWRLSSGLVSAGRTIVRKTGIFYWIMILLLNMLGTAAGDFLSGSSGLGYKRGALMTGASLAGVSLVYFFTKLSRIRLFWLAFALVRPFGATMGDVLTKSDAQGGLQFGTVGPSVVLAILLVLLVLVAGRRTAEIGPWHCHGNSDVASPTR